MALEINAFIWAVIAGLLANLLFHFMSHKRVRTTGAAMSKWLLNSLDSARVLLPVWFRHYIARKYGLDNPGKFVVDQYMRQQVSPILWPESPMYVSPANGKVLLDVFRYAAEHPDCIRPVSDLALRFARLGVFCNNQAADEFLSQVVASRANRGEQLAIEQPVWSEMTEEQQRNVMVPGELIDEYLKKIGGWFVLSRLVLFSSVFFGVLWLV